MRASAILIVLASASLAMGQKSPVDFEREVLPIFKRACFECHGTPRKDSQGKIRGPKAGLRLDGKAWLLRGSDNGTILAPKRPKASELYLRVSLPADDPDVMPPKGELLSEGEVETVRRWIAEGASFGSWQGVLVGGNPRVSPPRRSSGGAGDARKGLSELAKGLSPASRAAREKLVAMGAVIENMDGAGKLVSVHFASHEGRIGDKQVEALKAIQDNIVRLDLSRTRITDRSLARVAAMPRLLRLDLTDTAITNAGLRKLSRAPRLRELVLCGTKVDDQAIKALGSSGTLRSVYIWRTEISENGLSELAALLPQARVVGAPDLPRPEAKETDRSGRRRRRSK
ncbi:MAG TPA: hypothetical protein ENK43_07530 [Planctomycetes bacterium]|nr:hypothetical protein [Planctomycetota bacterium]